MNIIILLGPKYNITIAIINNCYMYLYNISIQYTYYKKNTI